MRPRKCDPLSSSVFFPFAKLASERRTGEVPETLAPSHVGVGPTETRGRGPAQEDPRKFERGLSNSPLVREVRWMYTQASWLRAKGGLALWWATFSGE